MVIRDHKMPIPTRDLRESDHNFDLRDIGFGLK
jgi:hypothetical protein